MSQFNVGFLCGIASMLVFVLVSALFLVGSGGRAANDLDKSRAPRLPR